MSSPVDTIDVVRRTAGARPTPDVLMRTVLEQQRRLDEQQRRVDQHARIVEKKSEVIANQKATIAVLHEQLRLANHKRFGASSEKNPNQSDWFADEAEVLADGEADPDDGERTEHDDAADTTDAPAKPSKPRGRKGLNPDLPRVRVEHLLSDADRANALDTFFTRVKEELNIEPARVQVIEHWQEKAVYLYAVIFRFVAGFIGSPSMNFLEARVLGGQVLRVQTPEHR